jgi:hypothetical protein
VSPGNKKIAATVRAKHHWCDHLFVLPVLCAIVTKKTASTGQLKKLNSVYWIQFLAWLYRKSKQNYYG